MTHLIDKSAVVAEIEKLKGKVYDSSSYYTGWQHALRMLELSLDTLEVKEVDLDAEIAKWEESFKHCPASMGYKETAKYFFELGMSVSNKAQKGEEYAVYI